MMNSIRSIPPEINGKWRAWLGLSKMWNNIHYWLGFSSTVLSAILVANAKSPFLTSNLVILLAALAAGLTFLLTTTGAQKRGKAFEAAARHLERAMAKFRTDKSLPPSFLGQAEAEALDKLDSLGG